MILAQPSSALPPAMHRTALVRPVSMTHRLTARLVTDSFCHVRGLAGGRPKSMVARRHGHLRPESRPSDFSACWLLALLWLKHSESEKITSPAQDYAPLAGAGRLAGAGTLVGWSPATASGAQPSSVGTAALPCIPSL